jgi:two-component system, OmpR family, sensor histidine kinase VicK
MVLRIAIPQRRQRARAVVIDDDAALTAVVCELLVDEGFEVASWSHWQGAHEFVCRERPDVILLDLRLGDGENGWRILDELALDASTRDTPVILCSGAPESLQARAPVLLPEHGIYVLTKPFEFERLLATVKQALETAALSRV